MDLNEHAARDLALRERHADLLERTLATNVRTADALDRFSAALERLAPVLEAIADSRPASATAVTLALDASDAVKQMEKAHATVREAIETLGGNVPASDARDAGGAGAKGAASSTTSQTPKTVSDAASGDSPAGSATAADGPADLPHDLPKADKPADKPKPVTADQAREALKAYAQREGNPAAMELLSSLGANSISGLDEKGKTEGRDLLAELVAKCKEA